MLHLALLCFLKSQRYASQYHIVPVQRRRLLRRSIAAGRVAIVATRQEASYTVVDKQTAGIVRDAFGSIVRVEPQQYWAEGTRVV